MVALWFSFPLPLSLGFESEVSKFVAEGLLTKNDEVITFDVGDRPCDSEVIVALTIHNKSGSDLRLKLMSRKQTFDRD